MKVEDIIKKEIEKLNKYNDTLSEILNISRMFKGRYGSEMFEYQKQFILNIHLSKEGCFVKKCRRAGISAVYSAHVAHRIASEGCSMGRVMILSPYSSMNEEIRKTIKMFLGGPSEEKILREKVIFATPGTFASRVCSQRSSEVYIDEADFIENLHDLMLCLVGVHEKIILVSTPQNRKAKKCVKENEEEVFDFNYYFKMSSDKNWLKQTIKWFEVPFFNMHLTWVKTEKEPTINHNGDVEYDKERWEAMLCAGWTPCSPAHDALVKELGESGTFEMLG